MICARRGLFDDMPVSRLDTSTAQHRTFTTPTTVEVRMEMIIDMIYEELFSYMLILHFWSVAEARYESPYWTRGMSDIT
jgi:hypothetical protein